VKRLQNFHLTRSSREDEEAKHSLGGRVALVPMEALVVHSGRLGKDPSDVVVGGRLGLVSTETQKGMTKVEESSSSGSN
jgi:hypothetical protein